MQDITATADVPKGSFYNHFESKEALGALIVDKYDVANELIATLLDDSVPPLDRLRGYFSGFIRHVASLDYARGCLLGSFSAEVADHSPLIRARLAAVYDRWTRGIAHAIAAGQADGSIARGVDPDVLATTLLDAFEGSMLRAASSGPRPRSIGS